MSYVVSSVLILFSLIKKKSTLLSLLLFITLWILFGFNTENADYRFYELMFNGAINIPDRGFEFLLGFFNLIGFTYQQFLIVITLICYVIIFISIKRYTENLSYVMALYFIFPFMFDVVQIRNFIALTILLYGLQYLFTNNKTDIFKYICFVLVASTIHFAFLFYLVLILVKFFSSWKKMLVILSAFIILVILILYSGFLTVLLNYLFNYPRVPGWFEIHTNLGFLVPFLLQIITFLFVYVSYKKYKDNIKDEITNKDSQPFVIPHKMQRVITPNSQIDFFETMIKINVIMFLAFPFYIYITYLFRIYRNILILNYIMVANSMQYFFKDKYERFIYGLFFIVWVFMLLINELSDPFANTSVLRSIFENNILF